MKNQTPIIQDCYNFLRSNAVGKWYESYRMKAADSDDFAYPISRGMVLLRVEKENRRAFYWLYTASDAQKFNEYVGLVFKGEAHEIIIDSSCRFFYDIDLVLDEIQKHEFANHYGYFIENYNESDVMDEVGKNLAYLFKESTLISLEEHGIENEDLDGFDWMFTMRNRKLKNDGFKISIHLITNMMISLKACSAISEHVKNEVICTNTEVLGIGHEMADLLCASIDETQYRYRGSLALPFGTKVSSFGEHTNCIFKNYDIPEQHYMITVDDRFIIRSVDLSNYNIIEKSNFYNSEASPIFVKEALRHIHNVKDYNSKVWDIKTSVLKRSTMYVKRYAPSMCSICKRTHDNDNTLFLIFNSETGVASWKCTRKPNMKPIVFYSKEDIEEDSLDAIEAFASKHSKVKTPSVKTPVGKSYRGVQINNKSTFSNRMDKNKSVSKSTTIISEEMEDLELFKAKYQKIIASADNEMDDPFDKVPYKKKTFVRTKPMIDVSKTKIDIKHYTNEGYDSNEEREKKKTNYFKIVTKSNKSKNANSRADIVHCDEYDSDN